MQHTSFLEKYWAPAFLFLALFVAYEVYGPVLNAPYIFDDWELPYTMPSLRAAPLISWISGNRPLLMFSFWLNTAADPSSTGAFHRFNILIHCVNSLLVFAIFRRFFPGRLWLSVCLAAVFLVHPLQTESVAYIAGRSESLAACFCLAAYAVFLFRPEGGVSWKRSGVILGLYGAAVLTKENAVVLPALFVVTDLRESVATLRRNFRLYVPAAVLGLAGLAMVARILHASRTAGFQSLSISWDSYALTEIRAIWHYVLLAIFPFRQSIDHDFPVSRSFSDHFTWLYFVGLVLLAGAAVYYRRRFPMAVFGLCWLVLFLAPTSSFVPIADPFVERRMYLPLVGLLFVAAEVFRRFPWAMVPAVVCLSGLAILTYQRNTVLSNPLVLWVDTVRDGTQKGRPYDFLVDAAVKVPVCEDVAPLIASALRRMPRNFHVLRASGKLMECMNKHDEAIVLLQRAVAVKPTSAEAHELLGLLYGEAHQLDAAREALDAALRLKPDSPTIRMSMALWYLAVQDLPNAANAYRQVLQLEPNNPGAGAALREIESNRISRQAARMAD